jgi:hypothetical protein
VYTIELVGDRSKLLLLLLLMKLELLLPLLQLVNSWESRCILKQCDLLRDGGSH